MKRTGPVTSASPAPPPIAPHSLLDHVRESGLATSLLGEIEQRVSQRRARRRAATKAGVAAVACLVLGWWTATYFLGTSNLATGRAHRETITLADGSQAELNARTHARADFRYGRRRVQVEDGEAFFSVAKDPAHPFVVETPAGDVEVTGTKFNVRLTTRGAVEVTLVEGHVRVTGVSSLGRNLSFDLQPGDRFDSNRPVVTALTADETKNVLSWRTGSLTLDGLTLGEAVDRFADYHAVQFELSPTVSKLRLGGRCALDDLDQFIAILNATNAVRVVKTGEDSYRVLSR